MGRQGVRGYCRCDSDWSIRGPHMVQRRTRSDHAVRSLTDLIDHMILEAQKLYKSTDMKGRCMLFHDALAQ